MGTACQANLGYSAKLNAFSCKATPVKATCQLACAKHRSRRQQGGKKVSSGQFPSVPGEAREDARRYDLSSNQDKHCTPVIPTNAGIQKGTPSSGTQYATFTA
jgi:hypothetical protein